MRYKCHRILTDMTTKQLIPVEKDLINFRKAKMCMNWNRVPNNERLAGGLTPGALHSTAVLVSEAALGKPCCI